MPAQGFEKKAYYHVYNQSIENRDLFNDEDDYQIFLTYLSQYLSPPPSTDELKTTFSVKGRTFKGVPHLPKNYFNKVELIAYSLLPDHFHLVIREITKGNLPKFFRSLSTRYAIYYNKKYNRKGSLFSGPYQSQDLENISQLLLITRHLHLEADKNPSSYPYYLKQLSAYWIKPSLVLSLFEDSQNQKLKDIGSYKKFVENYKLEDNEKEIVSDIIIEDQQDQTPIVEPNTSSSKVIADNVAGKPQLAGFFATALTVFVLLTTFGTRNVITSTQQKQQLADINLSPTPQVSGATASQVVEISPTATPSTRESIESLLPDESRTATPEAKIKPAQNIEITITDGSAFVNLRKLASINSEVVGQANDGDVFEYVLQNKGWYQIILNNKEIAYVSSKYARVVDDATNQNQ